MDSATKSLHELLISLPDLDDSLMICAEKIAGKWIPESKAWLVREDVEADSPAPLHGYFLEVSIAKEVLEGWSRHQLKRQPTPDEVVDRIIQYATNDA